MHSKVFVRTTKAAVMSLGCGRSQVSGTTDGVGAAALAPEAGTTLAIEKPQLELGFIKLTDMAPLAIAYEKGYFEDERQAQRNAAIVAASPGASVSVIACTGRPTFIDQIVTSLKTVFAGFLIATLAAIPLGIASGLSPTVNAGINPFIQIFRPVSPLAWLPIVTLSLGTRQCVSLARALVSEPRFLRLRRGVASRRRAQQ